MRNKWEEIVANTVIAPELEVRNLLHKIAVVGQFKIHLFGNLTCCNICATLHPAAPEARPPMTQLQVSFHLYGSENFVLPVQMSIWDQSCAMMVLYSWESRSVLAQLAVFVQVSVGCPK